MDVYLDHLKGERAGALDRFGRDVIRVGRNPEFELCFDDLGISYEHAELRLRDGDFWLVDLGSTNGSYVNEERAYNARLRDGDVLRFGKKGPVVRFRTTAVAAAAPAAQAAGGRDGHPSGPAQAVPAGNGGPPPFDLTEASALIAAARKPDANEPLADLPPLAPVGDGGGGPALPKKARSRRMTVPNMPALEPEAPKRPAAPAAEPASAGEPSSDPSGSSSLEARRAGERRIHVAPRPTRAIYVGFGIAAVVAVFAASAAINFWIDAERKGRAYDDEHHHAESARQELEDFRKLTADQQREEQIASQRSRDETRQLIERLEQSLEHERKESKRVDSESRQKIESLQQELARTKGELAQLTKSANSGSRSDNLGWKVIQKRLSRSIVLIVCSFQLKKKDGGTEPFMCFGSGFFVSKEGHIITNKHVVEPWKFRQLALRLVQEELEPDMSTYELSVWIAETRFANGRSLDPSTGYSTTTHSLEKVRTAHDVWTTIPNPGDKGPRSVSVHHESSNEDLALLKASGGPFDPIPLRRSDDGPVEKLDQVMLLGFPAGASILEKGIAESSPSLGQVRKVEDTIYVNAAMIGGNSGGPLVDTEGRVVGIATRTAGGTEALGICLKAEHVVDLYDGGSW